MMSALLLQFVQGDSGRFESCNEESTIELDVEEMSLSSFVRERTFQAPGVISDAAYSIASYCTTMRRQLYTSPVDCDDRLHSSLMTCQER
mmetsp:Transcript_33615/g.68258  ORF Transcript_33615/g.68258 Transcript_33615/m.68258 type:complete len:90 (-) Transcript_33615:1443-1712(-)